MRYIKLTEKQHKDAYKILQEMLDPNAGITVKSTTQTSAEKVNPTSAMTNLSQKMKQKGIDPNKPGVSMEVDSNIGGTDMTITAQKDDKSSNESVVISKKQLEEARLKKLKENSQVYKIKNFIK